MPNSPRFPPTMAPSAGGRDPRLSGSADCSTLPGRCRCSPPPTSFWYRHGEAPRLRHAGGLLKKGLGGDRLGRPGAGDGPVAACAHRAETRCWWPAVPASMPRRAIPRWCAGCWRAPGGRGGSPRCAPAPSCWLRPACWTGGASATHGMHRAELARRFPAVRVEPDPIFVRDGAIWTSAGVTAAIDLALALVEEDAGRALSLAVARHLVIFLKRPGGQAQFRPCSRCRARRTGSRASTAGSPGAWPGTCRCRPRPQGAG